MTTGCFQSWSEWKRSAEKRNLVRMTWTIFLPHTSYPIHLTGSDPICPIWSEIQIRYSCPSTLLKATVSCLDYYSSLSRPLISPWSAEDIKARVIPSVLLPSRLWCLPVSPAGKVRVPYHSPAPRLTWSSPRALCLQPCNLLAVLASRLPFQVLLVAVSSARNSLPMDISMAKPFTSSKFLLRWGLSSLKIIYNSLCPSTSKTFFCLLASFYSSLFFIILFIYFLKMPIAYCSSHSELSPQR